MDKQKIFVVDDKDMIGKIIMACLGRDYDCRYFDSPKPVLEQMEAGDLPDLIISDIRMPDMRGDEFLHAVKSDERFRHIRILCAVNDYTGGAVAILPVDALIHPCGSREFIPELKLLVCLLVRIYVQIRKDF